MRISLATGIRNLPSRTQPQPELYQNFLELTELAEDLGFHRFWLSEHHFAEDDWNPSPLLALSAAAGRTTRIRLGTYVMLPAMHNPLRLAEDCATVDILSNGRFDFGFGAGGMACEYEVFGINPKESFGRAYETLDIITRCWTEEEFNHQGKYFKFENVSMRPKPVQRPIPIYSAAMGPQSVIRSAERGYGALTALQGPDWENYERVANAAGKAVDVVSGPLYVHLADSREQAWDECEEGMHWGQEFYVRRGMPGKVPPVGEFRKEGLAFNQKIAVGTVDDVMEVLRAYKDEPCDEIAVRVAYAGMSHEHTKRSIRLLAKECMPEIATWGRTKAAA